MDICERRISRKTHTQAVLHILFSEWENNHILKEIILCKKGGGSRDSKHLLPHISYQDAHAKKHNINRRIFLTPTIQVVTELTLMNVGNKIQSKVNTLILVTIFGYKKEFKLTKQLLEYDIDD